VKGYNIEKCHYYVIIPFMFISIDAGGTNTRVAGSGELVDPCFVDAPLRRRNSHDFEGDLAFMVEAALRIADGEQIDAVGISTPGALNETKTELRAAKNLTGWVGKPLVASLSEGLDNCPVFYDDDVVAGSLGEAYFGDTEDDFDYIIWGTGIGGGAVRHEGSTPTVSVLNWRTYFAAWEADSGGAELGKKFGKAPEEFASADWDVVTGDFKRHLTNHVESCRPPVVIFGGGLAVRHAGLIADMGRDLGARIDVTQFGNNSGLMGGFGLIRHSISSS
jgi:predicted NBD/HSP70 family sugar kinase